MWEVMRAPFWPSGSLAIWTMISWPSRSRSLMEGVAVFSARSGLRRGRLGRGSARGSPARGSGRTRLASRRGGAAACAAHAAIAAVRGGACGGKRGADSAAPARAAWRSGWWGCGPVPALLLFFDFRRGRRRVRGSLPIRLRRFGLGGSSLPVRLLLRRSHRRGGFGFGFG